MLRSKSAEKNNPSTLGQKLLLGLFEGSDKKKFLKYFVGIESLE